MAYTGSALAAVTYGGEARVFFRAPDGHVIELAQLCGSWGSGRSLTREARVPDELLASGGPGALAAVSCCGDPRVYYCARNGHVAELWWDLDTWHHRDLTAEAGAPPLALGCCSIAAATYREDPRVYYPCPAGAVHELACLGTSWRHRNLHADARSAPIAPGTALAATSAEDGPRVYYSDSAGRVNELAWTPDCWSHRVLATGVDEGGVVAATAHEGGERRVYCRTADGHIHELSWAPGSSADSSVWRWRDISAEAPLAPPAGGTSVSAAVCTGGDPRVFYTSQGGHVQMLAWYAGEWHARTMTCEFAGAPLAARDSALAVIVGPAVQQRLYYTGTDGRVHELAWSYQSLGRGPFSGDDC